MAQELVRDRGCERRFVQIEHVLHNIVAERILHKRQRVHGDLAHKLQALSVRCMVNAPLQDTAPMAVCRHIDAVRSHRIINKLVVLCVEAMKTLLDDMVAVQVLDELHDVLGKRLNNHERLRARRQEVDRLLHRTCAVHVQRDAHEVVTDRFHNQVALRIGTVLQQLLAQVVAKRIRHQLRKVRKCLRKDQIALRRYTLVQLALQEAAPKLVAAQLRNVSTQLVELHRGEVHVRTAHRPRHLIDRPGPLALRTSSIHATGIWLWHAAPHVA